ncbi:restriction endonuclease [Cronobacter sakazakii]|nr:restriction endonuclease [Cronobacter sakazakii]PPX88131.1 restriction endonuclease [Cronobacter sakazakii]PPY40342.1 restriction endonuclease [Cronobacter sakazakii]PPY48503.1 restriction endonuclease [Cronobacter sakazakii]PQY75613.1 restriction endonuclease [Cronobacter sakazakii]
MISLGELVDIKGGGTPDKNNSEYWNGDIPWASVKDFKKNILDSTLDSITLLGVRNSATSVIPAGNIIVPTRMALGKVAINTIDLAINQDLKALFIKDNDVVDRDYLFRWLESQSSLIESEGKGATVKGITLPFLKGLNVPIPPINEQKRIAAILDKADAIRQKREQAIKLADDFLCATFATMYGNPITNPKKWPVHLMGEIIEFKGGNQPPKSDFIFEPKQGYIRLVQIRDFKSDKYATYIPQEKAKRIFEVDDVMIARYGPPVFQILRGLSGSYNVALMKASPKENIRKGFIFYLLQLPEYHDVVVKNSERTAGQTGVNLELLNKFNVPLPPIYYQDEILDRLARIEKFKEKIEISLNHLEIQFLSLQKRLMGF